MRASSGILKRRGEVDYPASTIEYPFNVTRDAKATSTGVNSFDWEAGKGEVRRDIRRCPPYLSSFGIAKEICVELQRRWRNWSGGIGKQVNSPRNRNSFTWL